MPYVHSMVYVRMLMGTNHIKKAEPTVREQMMKQSCHWSTSNLVAC